jgi:hypothetical protein
MENITAVEWLLEQITYDNGRGKRLCKFTEEADLSKYFDQAKQMERKQIETAFDAGLDEGRSFEWIDEDSYDYLTTASEYYTETFKK